MPSNCLYIPRKKITLLRFTCHSQKASIAELKTRLDEERDQRREEREKAAADLKASIQRVQSEAEEELKRVSDAASSREKEQQEVISKLQVVNSFCFLSFFLICSFKSR